MQELLERIPVADGAAELAVHWQLPAAGPAARRRVAFLYMHGFGSRQDGEKGADFRRRAVGAGHGFCSFDFRGHGASGGSLAELTFSRNLEDAEAVLAWLRRRWDGPVVFFGSSVGGATALWLAARRPGAFAAGLAIAPAVGMEADLAARLGEQGMAAWRESGWLAMGNEWVETELSWTLMEDLAAYRPEALAAAYRTPALLFQGVEDASVDWRTVVDFTAACGAEVELHLFGDGDHRLLERRPWMWRLGRGFVEGVVG